MSGNVDVPLDTSPCTLPHGGIETSVNLLLNGIQTLDVLDDPIQAVVGDGIVRAE